jgi:molecular chaperone GrpE
VTKHKSKKGTDHTPPAPEEAPAGPSMSEAAPSSKALEVVPVEEEAQAEEAAAVEGPPPVAAAEAAPAERIESLEKDLAQAQAQASEYLDGWQRERAEFLNYKKRVERDLENARAIAAASILTRYLAILDDIERALKDRPANSELQAWVSGIQLIQRKLQAILDAEGVETIPAEGMMFDPTIHEAVTFEPGDGFREGQIIEVLQKGYRIGERILRPAMVRVAR